MLGDKIRFVCEVLLRNKTIVQIGNDLETSDNTIRNLYKKDSVDSKYLDKLAELAGIPIAFFFEKDEASAMSMVNEGNANYMVKNKGTVSQTISKDSGECWQKLADVTKELADTRKMVIELLQKK